MFKVSDAGRIILDEPAKAALERVLSELKAAEEHLRISPSKIGSRIIERYAEAYFERDKKLLIKQHFDSKEYLKKAISSLESDADIARTLEAVLQKIRPSDRQGSVSKHARSEKKKANQEAAHLDNEIIAKRVKDSQDQ